MDYSLGKPVGPNRVPHINTPARIRAIPGTWVSNANTYGDMSGLTTYGKNE